MRGYNSSMQVEFTLKNIDTKHNILTVQHPRENFAFNITFKSSLSKRRKRSTSDLGPFTVVVFGNTSTGLNTSDTKTYTGSVNFLIPRDQCQNLHYICGTTGPGSGSSFTSTGTSPSCINFDPLKNCDGKSLCLYCRVNDPFD